METLSIYFFIIIIVYLAYSYFKSRSLQKAAAVQNAAAGEAEAAFGESTDMVEQAAIVAAIAAVMGGQQYHIRRVVYTGAVDERQSVWKRSGRQELMTRRVFFRKK